MLKILLIAGAILLALVAGVGGTFGVMQMSHHGPAAVAMASPVAPLPPPKPVAKPLYFATLSDITVSIPPQAGAAATSYVDFSVQMSTYDEGALVVFEELQPIIKAAIITLLMNETSQTLQFTEPGRSHEGLPAHRERRADTQCKLQSAKSLHRLLYHQSCRPRLIMGAVGGASAAVSVTISLLVILAFIFAAAYGAKRFRYGIRGAGGARIKIVAAQAVGWQSSIQIVEAEGQRFLIGASRAGITAIGRLSGPATEFSDMLDAPATERPDVRDQS